MDQVSSKLVAALLLLVVFVAGRFGAAGAQYGSGYGTGAATAQYGSGAAGTGPADGAGYFLGIAAALLAVAVFLWT